MNSVLRGETLPGLTAEQTNEIKLYYTEGTPTSANNNASVSEANGKRLIQGGYDYFLNVASRIFTVYL